MKTRAFLLTLPLLAVAACRDNRASLEIQAICTTTDDCKFSSTCTNTLMGEPAVDAAFTGQLWLPIQVANQMPNNASVATGRLNTNDAHVDAIALDYGGAAGLGTIVVGTNQIVPADGTNTLAVDVIPAQLNAQAALQTFSPTATPRTLVVNVRLRGYTDDGFRFETGDFPVAVQVCSGCIAACPTGTVLKCGPTDAQYPRTCG